MFKKVAGLVVCFGMLMINSLQAIPPKKVAFILQKNEFFSNDWENFKIPQDMKLYLITYSNNNIDTHSTIFEEIIQLKDFDETHIEEVIRDIAQKYKLSVKDVLLVTHDEYAIDVCANLRQKFGVYGSKPDQVLPYRNKVLAKQQLRKTDVKVPKYVTFNPEKHKTLGESYLNEIVKEIGFPMFAKPIDEARCKDVAKIVSPSELKIWAESHDASNFELEEFVDGQLYTSICIVNNNRIIHHGAHKFLYPCFEYMNSKKPLGGLTLPNNHEDVEIIRKVSEKIIKIFPIEDCVAHIELMKNKSGEFVFIEAAARQPGGFISDIYYKKSDIHLGKTNFMLQLGLPVSIPETNYYYGGWYWPHKPVGVVKQRHLPDIKSKYTYQWRVNDGEKAEGSQFLGDSAVRLLIWNADFDDLQKDMVYLEHSYQPVTMQ